MIFQNGLLKLTITQIKMDWSILDFYFWGRISKEYTKVLVLIWFLKTRLFLFYQILAPKKCFIIWHWPPVLVEKPEFIFFKIWSVWRFNRQLLILSLLNISDHFWLYIKPKLAHFFAYLKLKAWFYRGKSFNLTLKFLETSDMSIWTACKLAQINQSWIWLRRCTPQFLSKTKCVQILIPPKRFIKQIWAIVSQICLHKLVKTTCGHFGARGEQEHQSWFNLLKLDSFESVVGPCCKSLRI